MTKEKIIEEDDEEEVELDNILIKETLKKFNSFLKTKEMSKICSDKTLLALNKVVINIDSYVETLSYVQKSNKLKAIALKRISSIVHDTYESIINMEFSRNDIDTLREALKDALKNAQEYLLDDNEDSGSDLLKFDASKLFEMSAQQTKLDAKFFKSSKKDRFKNKLCKKLKADILMHCSPVMQDSDAERFNLHFRVIEGYVHIRNQRILMMDGTKIQDHYEFAKKIAREQNNNFVPHEILSYSIKDGISYAWFLKPQVIEEVFSMRDVNAWVCVRSPKDV